jgi:hypothetical protein
LSSCVCTLICDFRILAAELLSLCGVLASASASSSWEGVRPDITPAVSPGAIMFGEVLRSRHRLFLQGFFATNFTAGIRLAERLAY